jgi:hypothetical protein
MAGPYIRSGLIESTSFQKSGFRAPIKAKMYFTVYFQNGYHFHATLKVLMYRIL